MFFLFSVGPCGSGPACMRVQRAESIPLVFTVYCTRLSEKCKQIIRSHLCKQSTTGTRCSLRCIYASTNRPFNFAETATMSTCCLVDCPQTFSAPRWLLVALMAACTLTNAISSQKPSSSTELKGNVTGVAILVFSRLFFALLSSQRCVLTGLVLDAN